MVSATLGRTRSGSKVTEKTRSSERWTVEQLCEAGMTKRESRILYGPRKGEVPTKETEFKRRETEKKKKH